MRSLGEYTVENLFGLLIFVAIAAVSSILNAQKQKREDAERKVQQETRKQQRAAAPNMPEATRRMLYGDDREIPTAQPRQAAPAAPPARPAVPTAPRPQDVRPRSMQAPVPQQSSSQRPQQVAPQRPQPGRYGAPESTSRGTRPRALVQPQPVRRQSRQTMQQAMRPAQVQYQEEAPRAEAPPPRPVRSAPAPKPVTGNAAARVKALLHKRTSVRDAVVLSELLGPPVALREHGSRF